MLQNKLVSVIIPNYNHAPFLAQRINSVLNQTYKKIEVLILDDGSTDNSREIIEKYTDRRITHKIFNSQNSGSTFKQWQKGFELSKGEFVWIAETDDYCESTLLENLIVGFDQPDCVIAFCESVTIDEKKNVLHTRRESFYQKVWDGPQFVREFMFERNVLYNASMIVFRKQTLDKIPTDYQKYVYAGDYLFWIEMCMLGKVFESGAVLNYRRIHKKSVTSKSDKTKIGFIESIRIYDRFLKLYRDENDIRALTRCFAKRMVVKLKKLNDDDYSRTAREDYEKRFGSFFKNQLKYRALQKVGHFGVKLDRYLWK